MEQKTSLFLIMIPVLHSNSDRFVNEASPAHDMQVE